MVCDQTHDLPHSRRARLVPMIYHTRGEHGSYPWSTTLEASTLTITLPMWFTGLVCGSNPWSTALEVSTAETHDLPHSRWAWLKPIIYHTRGEHANYNTTDVVHWFIRIYYMYMDKIKKLQHDWVIFNIYQSYL